MELMSQYDPTIQALKKIIKKLKAEKKKLRKASPASAPEGWKIVPVEPTEEMVDAGIRSLGTADKFRAMLAAAPTPPGSEGADPVMTKEELIAAAESIEMLFTGATIPPVSEDRKDVALGERL